MAQRRSIIISCLSAIVIVAAVLGILWNVGQKTDSQYTVAETCDQLEISVGFPGGTEKIHIWKDDGGVFYFFLPSGADNWEIKFCNLGRDASVYLDSKLYTASKAIIDRLEFSKQYQIKFSADRESAAYETSQVIFLESAKVPALFLNTASGNMEAVHADKEAKEAGSMCLIGTDGNSEYLGQLEYIKSRGNSSFFDMGKKSYQIRLKKECALLDMPSAEKWILLADMIDDTLIKNDIVFRFAKQYTEVPAVSGRFVDLYLNGNYVGNYYLCEKIEIRENKINITDLEKETEEINGQERYTTASLYVSEDGKIKATSGLENPEDITGGYLVKHIHSNEYDAAENAFVTDSGHCYQIVSPDPATVEQAEYICRQFNELETALAQENGIHPVTGRHFSEYLDVDSWISKYLMEEMFHDPDAALDSMYFYKDSDSVDPHIYSGPMWDYDRALGSYGARYFVVDDPEQVGGYGIYAQEMMQHPEICEEVYDSFRQIFLPYAKYQAGADIYQISSLVKESVEMDHVRWPQRYGYYTSLDAGRDALIDFIRHKAEYLEDVWLTDDAYCTVTFLDYFGDIYRRYSVKKGEYIEQTPDITTYIAIFNGWRNVETNAIFDNRIPILEDAVYQSDWINMDILLLNGLAAADLEVSQVDPEILRQIADTLEMMQNQDNIQNAEEDDRSE